MSNILILGGTGAMGEHLVHLLGQDSDNHIYVTSRTVHKNQANVSYHVGNAHDDVFFVPFIKDAAMGCDCGFHGIFYC